MSQSSGPGPVISVGGLKGGVGGSRVIGKQKYGLHGAPVKSSNQGIQGGSSILTGSPGPSGKSGGGNISGKSG